MKWTRQQYENWWHDQGHWHCRPCILGPVEWVFLVRAVDTKNLFFYIDHPKVLP